MPRPGMVKALRPKHHNTKVKALRPKHHNTKVKTNQSPTEQLLGYGEGGYGEGSYGG